MSVQRIHLHLSKEALDSGRLLAHKKKTSISKLVESFFLGTRNHTHAGKTFSARWTGKVALRAPEKSDRRGKHLVKKYS